MTTAMSHNSSMTPFLSPPSATSSIAENNSTPNDLHKLKEISEKLNLATRRPSVVQWKQIIEYRKSRGQYVTSSEPQYLDNIVAQRCDENGEAAESKKREIQFPSDSSYKTLFQDSVETPTKTGLASPSKTVIPTPIRRHRRIAQVAIPELDTPDSSDQENASEDEPKIKLLDSLPPDRVINSPHTKISEEDRNQPKTANNDDLSARYRRISRLFDEIRRDLVIMRIEDNKLARKLLDVRSEMLVMKAQCSCDEHALMLDDIALEMEEEEELTGLIKACDLPNKTPTLLLSQFSPLRNIGVSKMNLNIRRFSIR